MDKNYKNFVELIDSPIDLDSFEKMIYNGTPKIFFEDEEFVKEVTRYTENFLRFFKETDNKILNKENHINSLNIYEALFVYAVISRALYSTKTLREPLDLFNKDLRKMRDQKFGEDPNNLKPKA